MVRTALALAAVGERTGGAWSGTWAWRLIVSTEIFTSKGLSTVRGEQVNERCQE